jgi:hypothetical protein
VDSNGNVFVTGYSGPDGAFDVDFVTLKYSAAGMPLWTNRFSGPAHGYDAPSAITVDSGGNVFVAGYSYFFDGSSGGYTYDMMTIKYSNTGTLLWLGRYPHAVATAAIVTHDGNLTVTGYSSVHDNPSDYVTLKYCSGFAASNDNFSSRIILNGTSVNTNGNNNCASREAGEPNHAGNIGGKSHWWSWAAPASGPVTITTCGSAFDTLLAVYTGTSISGLTLVTNNNDNVICGAGSVQSQVQFNAVSATTYQIAVDGYKDPNEPTPRSGNIVLTIQQ